MHKILALRLFTPETLSNQFFNKWWWENSFWACTLFSLRCWEVMPLLLARPRPEGFGDEGKGGARDVLAVWTSSSRANPSKPTPHRPGPASRAGPSPSCRPWARQLDSRVGGSLRGGGGRRLTGRPLSGFPSPPSSSRRQRRPGSAPGSRFGKEGPGPKACTNGRAHPRPP